MKRNTALGLLWPLGVVLLTALILAAGILSVIGIATLAATRRRRAGKLDPRQSGRTSVVQRGPAAEVILTPPAEATLSRAA